MRIAHVLNIDINDIMYMVEKHSDWITNYVDTIIRFNPFLPVRRIINNIIPLNIQYLPNLPYHPM